MDTVLTSTVLWQDFHPEAEALDVNVLRTEEFDGIVIKTVYFTGRQVADGKTRVLAKVACKAGKSAKPAVLLVDNYKKPIDVEELKFWANNGFVAMAIDFAGRTTKGPATLYPSSLDYCNSDVAKSYFYVSNSAKNTKIYEYALNCMRAITYLLQEENAKGVSVITAKKGTAVGVIVLSVDQRISNGAVVFGSLYREFPPYDSDEEEPDEMSEEALQKRLDYEQTRQVWTAGIAPQSYAMQIKVPVYLIASANSPYVSSEHSNKMYYRLNDNSRMLLLPLTMDYLSDEHAQCLVKWCKGTTVEENAEVLPYSDANGDNFVKVKTSLPHSKIDLWYSRNAESSCRNWVKAPLKKTEDGFIAELDVYTQTDSLVAFAFVKGQIDITTALCEVNCEHPSKVKIPTRILFACNGDGNLVSIQRGGGWHGQKHDVEYCKGYLDIFGAKGTGMATFAVNDFAVKHGDGFTVSFDVCCNVQQTLKAFVMTKFGKENVEYVQETHLIGDGMWQRITLEGSNFHSADGKQMPEDTIVEVFAVFADEEFLINNLFLV